MQFYMREQNMNSEIRLKYRLSQCDQIDTMEKIIKDKIIFGHIKWELTVRTNTFV